jgi:hypothetical protein
MDEETKKQFEEMDKKLDAVFVSVEKMRKYFKWTLIITLLTIVLPLIALAFVIPTFLKSFNYSSVGL